MDKELVGKIEALSKKGKFWKLWKDEEKQIMEFSTSFYEREGKVFAEVTMPDGKSFDHQLKDLEALFCSEGDEVEVKGDEEKFFSILSSIESAISGYHREHPHLLDRNVIFVLRSLIKNPERISSDELCRKIQLNLRFSLSLEAWSRGEVVSCLRCVLRSVRRHNAIDGPRGYLNFIVNYV